MFETDEYKGNKLVVLKRSEDDQYSFRFGLSKAKLILEHIDDIKLFVEENSNEE